MSPTDEVARLVDAFGTAAVLEAVAEAVRTGDPELSATLDETVAAFFEDENAEGGEEIPGQALP